MFTNSTQGYGLISVLFHWLLALLIPGLFALGVWMVELDYYSEWYHRAPAIHKAVGVSVVGLMILRWIWLRLNPRVLPLMHADWEHLAAKTVHALLYLGVLLLGTSGYLIATAEGQGVKVFDVFEVPPLSAEALFERQADLAGEIHVYVAYGLMALVVLHVAGALKHHFIDRDATLRRMLGKR
ncbi:cytochrome b [Thiomicrorhabdus cannonii]|uniref:cytochrome b n=1 Tax=Thiomicrorhabdus cannonii TaxID=2748011 RepID=UPI0015BBCE0A|nr:cytochrome b [Thiomicrorhabdus cannonii]